jgi:SAM-dependent methyltransferase
LDLDIQNLPQAQENYSNFMISHIPEGTKDILDVGCGVGKFALKLITLGYNVDCVSPSKVLTEHARNLLGNKSHIFECEFEDLQTEKQYDMILFSESFQYVKIEKALQNSIKFLKNNGHLLICDFFKTDVKGESSLRGGHTLSNFYNLVSQYPLQSINDIDITKETAPNLDIVNEFLTNVGLPIWNMLIRLLDNRYHLISKFLHWKYKEKIKKINRKYFSGSRNAEKFAIFKSYRLFLYKKIVA